jgi:hypothetical protein
MNWSKIWYVVSLLSLAGLVFYIGFLSGNRNLFSQSPSNITVTTWNNAQENSFTNIKFKTLIGRTSQGEIRKFGELAYRENVQSKKLDLMVRVISAPVAFSDGGAGINFPQSYQVNLAKRSLDGLNYSYTPAGTLVMNEPIGSTLSGQFVFVLEQSEIDFERTVERVMFFAQDGSSTLPPFDNQSFPADIRAKNAPYFWTE